MLGRKQKNQFTHETFKQESEQIVSVFLDTVKQIEVKNDQAQLEIEKNKKIIEEKEMANNFYSETINKNKKFVENVKNLFN